MDWDLSSFFSSVEGEDFREFRDALRRQADGLRARVEPMVLKAPAPRIWVRLILDFEDFQARMSHLGAYLSCLTSADTTNEPATLEESAFSELRARAETIREALIAALGHAPEGSIDEVLQDPQLEGAAFFVGELRELASRRMDIGREALYAALSVNSTKAWQHLHQRLSGDLTFSVKTSDGSERQVPMAQRSNLFSSSDRALREAAFRAGNEAWAGCEIICERALNAIAGTRLRLDRERGVEDFLENPCRSARIQRQTLDAMFHAIEEARPNLRRLADYRTELLGEPSISYRDLAAPAFSSGDDEPGLDWQEGGRLIEGSLAAAYPALGAFFRDMLDARWFDFSPRPNKRPGGFCTTSRFSGESRVFMTYEAELGSVLTLTHEVGHAWHSRILRETRPLASGYPMTLAESASTFAEMLLIEGVLESDRFSAAQKRALLDTDLRRAVIFCLELPVRFHFEKRFYEERRDGFVPARRLRELMVEEQRRSFGASLAEDGFDPLFWASKQHFYIEAVMFYNFPYTFGYLLSQALFARFREQGESFLPEYERFLAQSGSMSCEDLIEKTLGESITEPDFWARAVKTLDSHQKRMEALLAE